MPCRIIQKKLKLFYSINLTFFLRCIIKKTDIFLLLIIFKNNIILQLYHILIYNVVIFLRNLV